MAIATAVCVSYKQEVLEGVHTSEDTYKIALFTDTATLTSLTETYSSTNEVANGNGYTTGGLTLTGFVTGSTTSAAYLTFADAQWPNSSITARGCLIYNASKDNRAVIVCDFGENVVSVNGTFTLDMPTGAAGGLARFE